MIKVKTVAFFLLEENTKGPSLGTIRATSTLSRPCILSATSQPYGRESHGTNLGELFGMVLILEVLIFVRKIDGTPLFPHKKHVSYRTAKSYTSGT